jgi:CRISPR-associated protein Csb2
MFALGIQYLLGRSVAARWGAREEPEWPPHPDRVFMALVAAHGETGAAEGEGDALRWLEALPRPALWAAEHVSRRAPVTAFVPVNDTADPVQKGKPVTPMGSFPVGRVRQPRQFPAAVPESPSVFLIWEGATAPGPHAAALEGLCRKVTYLGHSSTPVQMWVEAAPPRPTLVPVDGAAPQRLRVPGTGRYDYLRGRHQAGLRPLPSAWQGYAPPAAHTTPAGACSTFDEDLLVLHQVGGRRFDLGSTLLLGRTLRAALMSRSAQQPPPEWLSGHEPSGAPSRRDRLAVVPLGFVGREHADGHLLGLGLALPRDLPPEEAEGLMRLLDAEPGCPYVRLVLGRLGECLLELDERPEATRPYTLRPSTYAGPAQEWATVAPLAFDQFPRRGLSAEAVVAGACVRAGLPRPVAVEVEHAPFLPGVPHSRTFPALPGGPGRPPRPLAHARLAFDRPVRGPVLVGAGRYLGYGLCRPCGGAPEEGRA